MSQALTSYMSVKVHMCLEEMNLEKIGMVLCTQLYASLAPYSVL